MKELAQSNVISTQLSLRDASSTSDLFSLGPSTALSPET